MNEVIARGKEHIAEHQSGEHEPLSGPEMAHFSFDFAQQVRIIDLLSTSFSLLVIMLVTAVTNAVGVL